MALAWNQNRKNNLVWNNKEIKKNMLELIGHTAVVRIDSLSRATGNEILVFWELTKLKMENNNLGRSIKDRAAKHIIEGMIKRQNIQQDKQGKVVHGDSYTIYEGTSGNTGISLGLLSSYYGIKAHIYLNNNLSQSKVVLCKSVSSNRRNWLSAHKSRSS